MKKFPTILVGLVLVAACFYFGAQHPFWFAGITAALTLAFSTALERSRLLHDRDYFFAGSYSDFTEIYITVAAITASLYKAILAGFLALLTFAAYGNEPPVKSTHNLPGVFENITAFHSKQSLILSSLAFVICAALASILILLGRKNNWGSGVLKLGYFRLAVPIGVLYSACISALTPSQFSEIKATHIAWLFDKTIGLNNDKTPEFEEASEFLSKLNAFIDQVIAKALDNWIPEFWVPLVDALLSSNVLQGFVLLPYTAVIIWLAMRVQTPVEDVVRVQSDLHRHRERPRKRSRKRSQL